ncbi:3-isopropylmalate dehydratase small subunit [Novosphingobium sp. Gsoil 351]|uniref:3-isopropylmalate dehydratase small subunit n=1 Tax=Novosphingobium sp. Gsoil 351 TaxID=2675225 RepID=UPI0012B4F3F6|nr:3-isopropylmalate dehydratase small subunit [Novosphingobium sp. Gsoil 351]QGN54429.1 3-isopropylmalate dehydratase small subunit [Novosphingobium sp. Gsoil 351]
MNPFVTLTSVAAPLLRDNVDTDAIIPSREMRSTGRTGLADGLFAPWRYLDADARTPDPAFVLNRPAYKSAQILLGGANFGCGSSREHAVWALVEWGIACIVAASFAPIFRNNCIRNGLLPVELDRDAVESLAGRTVTVDLPEQVVMDGDTRHTFSIDAEAKAMLVEGLDAIALTLKQRPAYEAWLAQDRANRPWVYP